MDTAIGLLLLRLIIGLLMIGHGTQTLFGWFGGLGFTGIKNVMIKQGLKPAWFWTLLGGTGEAVGGLLIVLGLFTPLGEIAIFASMFMVIFKVHWKQGLWNARGGFEYPLVILSISITLALTGPGSYSLDALIGISLPSLLLFVLGVIASILVDCIGIATSRKSQAEQARNA